MLGMEVDLEGGGACTRRSTGFGVRRGREVDRGVEGSDFVWRVERGEGGEGLFVGSVDLVLDSEASGGSELEESGSAASGLGLDDLGLDLDDLGLGFGDLGLDSDAFELDREGLSELSEGWD